MVEAAGITIKRSMKQFLGGLLGGRLSFEFLRALNRQKLLIICYHRVLKREDTGIPAAIDMFSHVDTFKEHMEFLSSHYTPVSEQDVIDAFYAGKKFPDFPVWVTFDDGYRDNYTLAYPVLKEFGIPATFFISTGLIDQEKEAVAGLRKTVGLDSNAAKAAFMSWEQIRELSGEGFHIGCHTRSHRILSTLDAAEVEAEISHSKNEIERRIGRPVLAFAYPHGKHADYNAGLCIPLLEKYGFKIAVSTMGGNNDLVKQPDPFELRRVGMSYKEPFGFYKLKVGSGSAWQK
ncbi:MAG: polysaccharide deacetylase family protein [Candidatus Omnitrophica bacterium]|nr:polysaccharide deacetylase family protein [Candidatus Omnitrophota bacterium]MDD5775800.1 polysaccharide deacetylase family protein [Candidatus Omnitrophota bacterium]